MMMVVDVGLHPRLVSPLLTSCPGLVSRRKSVLASGLLTRGGGLPLDQVDNPAIKLVLRHLLVILENSATEDESLPVSWYPHCPAYSLLELFDCLLLINFCELVILGVQGFDSNSPHILDNSLNNV